MSANVFSRVTTSTILLAGRAIMRSKGRSLLTALGVIIGVGAVIATVAMGEGARARVEQAFSALGTNLLIVTPGSTSTGGVRGGFGSASTLTWGDLRAIRTEIPSVRYAAPLLRSGAQVVSEEQNWYTQIYGTTADYFGIRQWPVSSGSALSPSDDDSATRIAVLGQTVVDRLFAPNSQPVGQTVRIRGIPFRVVGVLARKGQSAQGQDFDDGIYLPVKAFQTSIQGNGLGGNIAGPLFVSATTAETTLRAQAQVTSLLRDRHGLAVGAADDFSIRNLTETASAQDDSARALTMLLAGIAGVSLLVGGIGIMNIMLVSVTERTREIGVRMAVGAQPMHILAQFMVEALALSALGGLLGVALGLGVSGKLAASFGWPSLIRLDVPLLAMAFAVGVGVVFGLYPAWKASRLHPIDALRFE
jgi:putative ABC transport system permease protein